jgi:hypothetical protein
MASRHGFNCDRAKEVGDAPRSFRSPWCNRHLGKQWHADIIGVCSRNYLGRDIFSLPGCPNSAQIVLRRVTGPALPRPATPDASF